MFWDDSQKAYVSTDAVGNSSTLHQSGGGLVKIPYRIFVGGIAFNTTKEELKEFFSRYGAVRDTKIIRDPEGLSKGQWVQALQTLPLTTLNLPDQQNGSVVYALQIPGCRYGFVTFYREEDAQKVMNMGTIFFKEKRLNISEAYRKHAVTNQQVVTMPVAAPTTWPSASSTPVYYTTLNQAPQIPTIQLPSARTLSVVPGGVTVTHQPAEIMPQYYYVYY